MLRVPWSTGTIDGQSTNALGNPELLARLRLTEAGDTEWAVRLGVGVPIAQGTLDPSAVRDPGGLYQGICSASRTLQTAGTIRSSTRRIDSRFLRR